MKITSRFTIAVHIISCIHTFSKKQKVTSEFIASSVMVNPVIIRRTMGQLKEAGLIDISRGTGGSVLTCDLHKTTLLDVFNAVNSMEGDLFNFHEHPNPLCPVGRNIHRLLDGHLSNAQKAMETSLNRVKLAELTSDLSALVTHH